MRRSVAPTRSATAVVDSPSGGFQVARSAGYRRRSVRRQCRVSGRCAVRAPRLMGEVYRRILDRLVERGWAPPRARPRLARWHLLWIVLRYSFF